MANRSVKLASAISKLTILDLTLRDNLLKTSRLSSCEGANKVWFQVVSTLDVPLGFQKIGNDDQDGTSVNVGEVIYLEQSSTSIIEVAESERTPFMGCQIQSESVATVGNVTITLLVEGK